MSEAERYMWFEDMHWLLLLISAYLSDFERDIALRLDRGYKDNEFQLINTIQVFSQAALADGRLHATAGRRSDHRVRWRDCKHANQQIYPIQPMRPHCSLDERSTRSHRDRRPAKHVSKRETVR